MASSVWKPDQNKSVGAGRVSVEQLSEELRKLKEEVAAYGKNMQKWEEGKTHFVEDVISQQSSLDKSVINELNTNQPDVKRVGLITKGNINKSDVYLSINENGDLIYDVVKNGKYLSIEIVKKFKSSIKETEFSVTLLMAGSKFPQKQKSIYTKDGQYVRFLPKEFVYDYGPDKYIRANEKFSDEIDELPAFEKKTARFIRTFMFAETDLTLTKSAMIKREEDKVRAEQKLRKQAKKNEKIINIFLSDKETNWFNTLVNKIRGRGN